MKNFAKLVITCCRMIVYQTDEETIRECCIVTKEVLRTGEFNNKLDSIVRKYSSFLALLFQRIGTVHTRLTQTMILEVIFSLTSNSVKMRNEIMKKQKFRKHPDPNAPYEEFLREFVAIAPDNVDAVS